MSTSIQDLITSTLTGGRSDPFPTFKFHVEVGGIIEAAFTECSGLEMSMNVKEYEEGGLNDFVHKFPGRTKVSNVTLKRGFALSNEIFKWYKEMEDCIRQGKKFTFRPVTITLYTTVEFGKLMRWNLDKAFPVRWVGPTLKTDEAAVAVEALEFAHHGIHVLGR
jgi:phage tail-like protein